MIETSKSHVRPAAWEAFVVTGRARAAIRRAAREAERKRYVALGRQLIVAAMANAKLTYADEKVKAILPKLGAKSVDDVLAAAGRNEAALDDVLKVLCRREGQDNATSRRASSDAPKAQDGWFNIDKVMSLKFRTGATTRQACSSAGAGDSVPVLFEPGGAVPGDRIVGVLSPGVGIRIFQIHSPRLKDVEHEGWIDVTWDVIPRARSGFPRTCRHRRQRAGLARRNRRDHRRDGRQHREPEDGTEGRRFHGIAHRDRGLRSGASQSHHRRA